MQKISTPEKITRATTRHNNIKSPAEDSAGIAPRESTLRFIRQFARCYSPCQLSIPTSGIVMN